MRSPPGSTPGPEEGADRAISADAYEDADARILSRLASDEADLRRWAGAPDPADLIVAAEVHRLSGDPLGASDLYDQALQQDPASPLAKSGVLFFRGDPADRISGLEAIVRQFPDLALPRRHLANAHGMWGDLDRAKALVDANIRDFPTDPIPWSSLGLWLDQKGRRDEAVDATERYAEMSSASPLLLHRAASRLFMLRRYRSAFRRAWQTARFPGWRNRVSPITVPFQASPPIIRLLILYIFLMLVLISLAFRGARTSVPLAATTLLLLGWMTLASLASRPPGFYRHVIPPHIGGKPAEEASGIFPLGRSLAPSDVRRLRKQRWSRFILVSVLLAPIVVILVQVRVRAAQPYRMIGEIDAVTCPPFLKSSQRIVVVDALRTVSASTTPRVTTGADGSCHASFSMDLPRRDFYIVVDGSFLLTSSATPGHRQVLRYAELPGVRVSISLS